MSAAPTPAPHVPVNYLKAGGAGMFSARCVELLAKAGYTPEMFGTYDHVAKLNRAARDNVAAHDAWVAGGRQGPEPACTDQDRFLAGCQSGHLTQNACFQTGRDDPCSNVGTPPIPYDCGMAPCMPQWGGASQHGSDHYLVSRHEETSGAAAGPRGAPYPGSQIDAHSDDRARQLMQSHSSANASQAQLNQIRMGSDRRTQATATAAEARDARHASATEITAGAAQGQTPSSPSTPGLTEAEANELAECINNFRKAAMAEMRKAICSQEGIAENERQHAANSAPNPPPNGPSRIQAAQQREADAQAALANQQVSRPMTDAQRDERARLRSEVENSRRARVTATAPGCLAAAGRANQGIDPNVTPNGVVPENARDRGLAIGSEADTATEF